MEGCYKYVDFFILYLLRFTTFMSINYFDEEQILAVQFFYFN